MSDTDISWKGPGSALTEFAPSYVLDPLYGQQLVTVYQGAPNALFAEALKFYARGAHVEIRQLEGPVYHMQVNWGDLGQEETPAPQWERVSEWREMDIRSSQRWISRAGSAGELAAWYEEIKGALRDGTELELEAGSAKHHFFEVLARGGDTVPVKTYVLRRRWTLPLRYLSQSEPADADLAYTTARLRREFEIPDAVGVKLPVGFGAPERFVWGWVERSDNSVMIPYYGRAEEIREWVFGLLSTTTYEVLT